MIRGEKLFWNNFLPKSCFKTTFCQKAVLKQPFQNVSKKSPWKRDNKNLYMATCSQLSYLIWLLEFKLTVVLYHLSILMMETEFIVLTLKKRAYLYPLCSCHFHYSHFAFFCSVTNSMRHSYHSPFHGSRSSNFDFFGECVQFCW